MCLTEGRMHGSSRPGSEGEGGVEWSGVVWSGVVWGGSIVLYSSEYNLSVEHSSDGASVNNTRLCCPKSVPVFILFFMPWRA